MVTKEEEEAARRIIEQRRQARNPESLPRLGVMVFYAALGVWLAVDVRAFWVGESYSTMRNGGSMVTTGSALWVECLAPLFGMAAVYFRLDAASLGVANRRVWSGVFMLLCGATYVLAPHLFGKVTFLH